MLDLTWIGKVLSKLRFLSFLGVILFLVNGNVFGQKLENKGIVTIEKPGITKPVRQTGVISVKPDTIPILKKKQIPTDSIASDETAGFDAEVEYTADGYITIAQSSSGNKI